MTHEFDLYGVFVPDILLWCIAAFALSIPVRGLLSGLGIYRLVWHRALFDVALFVLLLGGLMAASQRYL